MRFQARQYHMNYTVLRLLGSVWREEGTGVKWARFSQFTALLISFDTLNSIIHNFKFFNITHLFQPSYSPSVPCNAGTFSISQLACRLNAQQGILFEQEIKNTTKIPPSQKPLMYLKEILQIICHRSLPLKNHHTFLIKVSTGSVVQMKLKIAR